MEKPKIEDSIMKLASEVFARELMPFFGIKEKVVATVPTELIRLDISRQYMDYTYLTEDGVYHHFEFQSTNDGLADMHRFHTYEVVLMMKTGKPVVTHVIFSGNIKAPLSGYEYGLNAYYVDIITMSDKDAEERIPIKEVMLMTHIGQMIMDEGLEKGLERGLEKGIERAIEILLDIGMPEEEIKEKIAQKYDIPLAKAEKYLKMR